MGLGSGEGMDAGPRGCIGRQGDGGLGGAMVAVKEEGRCFAENEDQGLEEYNEEIFRLKGQGGGDQEEGHPVKAEAQVWFSR